MTYIELMNETKDTIIFCIIMPWIFERKLNTWKSDDLKEIWNSHRIKQKIVSNISSSFLGGDTGYDTPTILRNRNPRFFLNA